MPYEILLQHVSIVPCLCVFGISHFGLYYLYSSTNGVYYNLDGHPPYIIGEAKYGSSRLAILADGTPQMSDKWIIDRLENAVGEGVANDIKMEMILKWK